MPTPCRLLGFIAALLLALAPVARAESTPLQWQLLADYPHLTQAFTQGLTLHGDVLYESSGLYQRSFISRWQLNAPQEQRRQRLRRDVFGEGVTVMGEQVYVLTWRGGVGLIFDAADLRPRGQFTFQGEGWGLSHNGSELIVSDGSAVIRFINPTDWKVARSLTVTENGQPVEQLNELEWIDGKIYANIWHSPRIVVIDPTSGLVTHYLDLSTLATREATASCTECVLNGIAYDPADQTLLITGKQWQRVYRLKVTGGK